MPAIQIVIDHRKDDKTPKHETGPIHVYQRWVGYRGETDHDVRNEEVSERDDVDVETAYFAKIKLGRKERLSIQALSQHQAEDDDVGGNDAKSPQCDDDIEGNRRADVDETQQCRDRECRYDCVDWDIPARWHLRRMSVGTIARKWTASHT